MFRFVAWCSLLTLSLAGPRAVAESSSTSSAAPSVAIETFDARLLSRLVFTETNRVRRANHRKTLRRLDGLDAAADEQASHMALLLKSTHTNLRPTLRTAVERVQGARVRASLVAENVEMIPLKDLTYPEAATLLVKAWMDSPGHRVNVLHPDVDYMGCAVRIARLATGEQAVFAVQVFIRADRRAELSIPGPINAP